MASPPHVRINRDAITAAIGEWLPGTENVNSWYDVTQALLFAHFLGFCGVMEQEPLSQNLATKVVVVSLNSFNISLMIKYATNQKPFSLYLKLNLIRLHFSFLCYLLLFSSLSLLYFLFSSWSV